MGSVCLRERDWLVALVRELVAAESPSDNRAALSACGDLVEQRCVDVRARQSSACRVA